MSHAQKKTKTPYTHTRKEIAVAGKWFKEYGLTLTVIIIATASVIAFYYWFIGTLLPYS